MKAFTKRFACLTLALVLMVCLMPDVIPKAQATAIPLQLQAPNVLPFTLPDSLTDVYDNSALHDIVEGDGYNALMALYKVMATVQRATGVQYVEYNAGTGAYVPTQKMAEMSLQSVSTIYNGLERAEQTQLWDMAVEFGDNWKTGKQTILNFRSDLIDKVKGIFTENYPAVSTVNVNDVDINTVRGLNIAQLLEMYGTKVVNPWDTYVYIKRDVPFYLVLSTV